LTSTTKITFYGGISEIGGNKFLIEDKGTKIFLDFGQQIGKFNTYFSEFVSPRTCNSLGDLFEFELLPKLKGLYRKDYCKHMCYDDNNSNDATPFHAVLLSHAHLDHCAYIHYLRPDIPIYCSEATKLIMQCLQDVSGEEEYIDFVENFVTYTNKKGELSRRRGSNVKTPRTIKLFEEYKEFSIDSISIEPLPVDHSLPGVCGFIVHTSNGSIAYTGDIRFHGRRTKSSEKFIEKCSESNIEILLCEGTRIKEESSNTEFDVESSVKNIVDSTESLVICNYPPRDLDRLLSIYNAVKETTRYFVIDLKQAYLLKLFQNCEKYKNIYPNPNDKNIKIYIPRRGWGLIDKDINIWTKKQLLQDYLNWVDEFIDYPNSIFYKQIRDGKQNEFLFYCSDFQIQELIDIQPKDHSAYIRSSTEPFNEETKLDQIRVKKWLSHFRLLNNVDDWYQIHVSGHGSQDQLKQIVQNTNSKRVVPVHTENEDYYYKWHNNVISVKINDTINL
jgi:ribonuclease J